jgi:uncharacterized membrane protein
LQRKKFAGGDFLKHDAGMSEQGRPIKLLPIILFNAAYMLAAVAASMARGNKEFLFYLVVMLILIGVMMVVHRRVGLTMPLLWAFSVWGFLHMAGGLCPLPEGWPYNGDQAVLYSWWLIPGLLKYDQIVHAFGFGVTTWLCWHGARQMFREEDGGRLRPGLGVLILCAAAGMGFGALNEVVEFIAVLTIPNTNVGGYENTGWDLVANLTGTLIAVLSIRLGSGRG